MDSSSAHRQIASADFIAALKRAPLFRGMGEDVMRKLLASATIANLGRRDIVFLQGEPVSNCFVVLSGWIKLYRLTAMGDEALVAMFTRGQTFAEAAAFLEGTYPASAEAVTESRLLCIPTHALVGQIRQDPVVALSMLASVAAHLHHLVREIEHLKARSGVQRVAEFLTSLSPKSSGACEVTLPYDKTLIAAHLGMKPESLSRAFARLRDVGVQVGNGTATIGDVGRLRNYAQVESAGGDARGYE